MSQATHQDAELIVKLYELRREAVMREARNFVGSFTPSSFDELWAVMSDFSTKENAYLRQVYSYWEMVAALIAHGTINAALVPGGHTLDVHDLLVIGAVVVHDGKQGDAVVSRGPQHARRVHEIAIALGIDHQAAMLLMSQRGAYRGGIIGRHGPADAEIVDQAS